LRCRSNCASARRSSPPAASTALVKAIEGDIVHVEIAPGTLVRVDRRAVAAAGGTEETVEDEAKPQDGSEPVSPPES